MLDTKTIHPGKPYPYTSIMQKWAQTFLKTSKIFFDKKATTKKDPVSFGIQVIFTYKFFLKISLV